MERHRNPDPGAVFDFEDERTVLGHLRAPHDDGGGAHAPGLAMSEGELADRITVGGGGAIADYTAEELSEILQDLEAQGDAIRGEAGWAMSDQGFAKLTGPNGNEPPPMSEARVKAMFDAGEIDEDGVAAWKEASDAYGR